jgi:hypothetical protein
MLEQQVGSDKAAMAAIYGTERGSRTFEPCSAKEIAGWIRVVVTVVTVNCP